MPVVNYTTVNGRILHEDRNGVKTLFMPDTLGNVIETRNMDTGAQTSSTTYWPYGEVRTQTGTNPSPFGFCGVWGYYTQAGQPTYVRARYYRPNLGRWQTVDPLWPNEASYGYVGCIPLQFIDFTGAQLAPIGIGGALGAAPKITPLPRGLPGGWRIVPGGGRGNCMNRPGIAPRFGPSPNPVPGPIFIPPDEIERRARKENSCKEILYWYKRVCNSVSEHEHPYDASYPACEPCDGPVLLWIKSVHWCECCRLRTVHHLFCKEDDAAHIPPRENACKECMKCMNLRGYDVMPITLPRPAPRPVEPVPRFNPFYNPWDHMV
jgi:RHS repeat-associated protein